MQKNVYAKLEMIKALMLQKFILKNAFLHGFSIFSSSHNNVI
jgi:hypothetical protein